MYNKYKRNFLTFVVFIISILYLTTPLVHCEVIMSGTGGQSEEVSDDYLGIKRICIKILKGGSTYEIEGKKYDETSLEKYVKEKEDELKKASKKIIWIIEIKFVTPYHDIEKLAKILQKSTSLGIGIKPTKEKVNL